MSNDLTVHPEYVATMERLKRAEKTAPDGSSYWMARDVYPIFGYASLRNFDAVLARAAAALKGNGLDPSHHIAQTRRVMGAGNGAQQSVEDFYLSRAACSLVAMNGDPSKPEVAATQAYFAVQTRRMEMHDELAADEKRIEKRAKVTRSFKRVSGVAKDAGVTRQALFHDARYRGLYDGLSARDVQSRKGLGENENLFDNIGTLELSVHDLQMELAADVIAKAGIRGEQRVILKNKEIATHVRDSVRKSGGTMPEDLPAEEPIKIVKKRVEKQKKSLPPK